MKRYEYVNIHIGKLCGAKSEEHRDIINEYAEKGYRYVGYIPTNISDYGSLIKFWIVNDVPAAYIALPNSPVPSLLPHRASYH